VAAGAAGRPVPGRVPRASEVRPGLFAALADLAAIEQLHKDQMIGQYDAAVIDKEDGKPHVLKRMDRPHIRVIPEWFGGGALPRKELHEAAEQLTASQAGLIPPARQGSSRWASRPSNKGWTRR
jgi:hypothetical protein